MWKLLKSGLFLLLGSGFVYGLAVLIWQNYVTDKIDDIEEMQRIRVQKNDNVSNIENRSIGNRIVSEHTLSCNIIASELFEDIKIKFSFNPNAVKIKNRGLFYSENLGEDKVLIYNHTKEYIADFHLQDYLSEHRYATIIIVLEKDNTDSENQLNSLEQPSSILIEAKDRKGEKYLQSYQKCT